MSELLRAAIVGTAHSGDRAADRAGSAADALLDHLPGAERERALLLRAGAHAVLRRAGRILPARASSLPAAEPEVLRPSSAALTTALRVLLESNDELLSEALERMAKAQLRLAPELLPLALQQTLPARRARLRPVLGRRGEWLARQRPEWAWALAADSGDRLPADFDPRWSEGNLAERRNLLSLLRRLSPARARELAAEAWKHEKAEQRAAFLEVFALRLSPDDRSFLESALSDRSAHVRHAAARLLWRLPDSELARRMSARAHAHLRYEPPHALGAAPHALARGQDPGRWQVTLPPEPLDPAWERDGILDTPPNTRQLGQRQWWLLQLVASVACSTWLPDPHTPPRALAAAALQHEFAGALLDGLTRSALAREDRAWFAPLWDAWAGAELTSTLTPHPRITLSAMLTPDEITARTPQLIAHDKLRELLPHLPRPWPEPLAHAVLAEIAALRVTFRDAIPAAALGVPVALLPDAIPLPDLSEVDYPLRPYVRALENFQQVAALRRSIAAETTL